MIYFNAPNILLQNFICLDVGQKKTGIANNFAQNTIAFVYKTMPTENILQELLQPLFAQLVCNYIIVGLPFAYPESESHCFITNYVEFLQTYLQNYHFIYWDETSSSQIVREQYKYGRKGFSKNFYNSYDAKSASIILQDFLAYNF